MSKNLLLIFTRNPELGKVKTRLAKTIGDQKALAIYTFLLEKTCAIASTVDADKFVFYSEKIRTNDIWDAEIFKKKLQYGSHLGERMQHAFQTGFFQDYQNIIIIGSDLYDLSTQEINEAFEQLKNKDIVIGPAKDGGYYLLGMNTFIPEVFLNKNWGSSSVRKDTLKDLYQKKVALLSEKNDIDFYEDIVDIPEIMNTFMNTDN